MEEHVMNNPLGTQPVGKLLRQFAIPSIVAMLVGSLYNIVDQFFIGHTVGSLGNAATSVVYPLTISCIAIALLFGVGGASAFNLALGMGRRDEAKNYLGNAATLLFGCGLILAVFVFIFARPLMYFFGSSDEVLPYAMVYVKITCLGFPFLILSAGGAHLVRADGSPNFSMILNVVGAIINTVLDAIFVFGLQWGMMGAALATIIGQIAAAAMVVNYLRKCKTVQMDREAFLPNRHSLLRVMSLGSAACFNQVAMMVLQIVLNKSLKYYGGGSVYGESIPIACAGIVSKVNGVVMAFIIGIAQGLQPIASFNYGARQYSRVQQAYFKAIRSGAVIAVFSFVMFQVFPRQLTAFFGEGSEEYFAFAINYFRIFFFFVFTYFMQPITSNFFNSIGKAKIGIFLALTRQIIFYLPLLLIFPMIMGIDGIMYAGAAADFLAFFVNVLLIVREYRRPEWKSEA